MSWLGSDACDVTSHDPAYTLPLPITVTLGSDSAWTPSETVKPTLRSRGAGGAPTPASTRDCQALVGGRAHPRHRRPGRAAPRAPAGRGAVPGGLARGRAGAGSYSLARVITQYLSAGAHSASDSQFSWPQHTWHCRARAGGGKGRRQGRPGPGYADTAPPGRPEPPPSLSLLPPLPPEMLLVPWEGWSWGHGGVTGPVSVSTSPAAGVGLRWGVGVCRVGPRGRGRGAACQLPRWPGSHLSWSPPSASHSVPTWKMGPPAAQGGLGPCPAPPRGPGLGPLPGLGTEDGCGSDDLAHGPGRGCLVHGRTGPPVTAWGCRRPCPGPSMGSLWQKAVVLESPCVQCDRP